MFDCVRRSTALVAAFLIICAVCVQLMRPPTTSAQCYGCPGYGYGTYGPSAISPYGYGMYGAYGMNPYGYGITSPYAMNPFGYSFAGAYGTPAMTYQPSYATAPMSSTYGMLPTYVDSGQYCTDKSGGQVWVNTGAPADGLSCGGSAASYPSPSSASAAASPATAAQAGNAVRIANFSFNPAAITLKAGQTVTWTNGDTVPHTSTSDNGAWNSGPIQPGASFSQTFATAGTFTYHCTIHPNMHGSITVLSP